MALKYRKRIGRFEDWHFHPACPDWPEANYVERSDAPPAHEICLDCIKADNAGNIESES